MSLIGKQLLRFFRLLLLLRNPSILLSIDLFHELSIVYIYKVLFIIRYYFFRNEVINCGDCRYSCFTLTSLFINYLVSYEFKIMIVFLIEITYICYSSPLLYLKYFAARWVDNVFNNFRKSAFHILLTLLIMRQ